MERPFICKCLTAEYEEEKSVLRGPVHIQFDIGKEQLFHVDIEQAVIRSIKISTDSDVSIFDLNTVLSKIERLLMLLDGRFIQLKEMKFSESDVFSNDSLIPCAQNLIAQRSSYFCSADFCKNASYRLIDFENVFTPDLFSKWDDLLDELGVVHQMFLYSVSDSKITIDVKCAFLVELAEPIVEVVKERTYYFASLEPGSRGTTLKNCLDASGQQPVLEHGLRRLCRGGQERCRGLADHAHPWPQHGLFDEEYPDRQATDRPARKRTCCLHKLPSLRKCSIFLLLCCRESRDGNVPAFPFP